MNDAQYEIERKERWFKYHPPSGLSFNEIDEIVRLSKDWRELSEKLNIEDILNTSLDDNENFRKCFHARRYLWAKIRGDEIMIQEMERKIRK